MIGRILVLFIMGLMLAICMEASQASEGGSGKSSTYFSLGYSNMTYELDDDYLTMPSPTGGGGELGLGYKSGSWAYELMYSRHNTKATDSYSLLGSTVNHTLEIDDNILGFGIRYFFLSILNLKFGINYYKFTMTQTVTINNVAYPASEPFSGSDAAFFVGGGLNIPIGSVDLYGDYIYHDLGASVTTVSGGLRFYY